MKLNETRISAEDQKLITEEAMYSRSRLEATTTLVTGLAQVISNQMTRIRGCTELLRLDLADRPEALECLSTIEKVSERTIALTDQMLASAGLGKFKAESIDLNSTAYDALRSLVKSIMAHKIHISMHLDSSLRRIHADPELMRLMLINVFRNAFEAIPDDGRIKLSSGNLDFDEPEEIGGAILDVGPYICFCVEDDGNGMRPEVLARAFEPFFTTKSLGRGFGLSAVYGTVRSYGGAVVIESEEGKRTVVRLFLPAVADESGAKTDSRQRSRTFSKKMLASNGG